MKDQLFKERSWRRATPWKWRVAMFASVMSLAACGGSGSTPPAHVEVTPTTLRVAQGSSVQLASRVLDEAGNPVAGRSPTWSSSDVSVATVSASGLVTGAKPGTASIDASIDGNHTAASIAVAAAAVVDLSAGTNVLAPGGSVHLQANILDATNAALSASLTWSSSDASVATVGADGTVVAVAPGIVTLTGTTAGIVGSMALAVQAPVNGQIAFVSKRGASYGVPPTPSGGVYFMNADGSNVRQQVPDTIVNCVQEQPSLGKCALPVGSPAVAPDGLRVAVLALVRWRPEFAADTMIEICATTQQMCTLLDYPGQTLPAGQTHVLHGVGAPSWSPSGTKLAFVGPDAKIWIWDLATATWTSIDAEAGSGEPVWSPDGTHIAYSVHDSAGSAIWVMSADGVTRNQLSPASVDDTHPAWSPDGTRLAFVRTSAGDADIWVMRADGSQASDLTLNPAQDRNPAWSPAGDRIAFDTDRDGNLEVYTMDATGGALVNRTQNAAADTAPAWSR